MLQPWIVKPTANPSAELLTAVGGHPLVAQLLAQRGISTPAQAMPFLDPAYYTPASPAALTGVEEAAHLLHQAINQGQNFLVWGDFDVDGQTSTALLATALHTLVGARRVRFHVPNRLTEGHGIRLESLRKKLANASKPLHVLLTCDTGIAETEAVAYAKAQGMTVIITDHHDLPAEFQGLTPGVDPLWGIDATQGRRRQRSPGGCHRQSQVFARREPAAHLARRRRRLQIDAAAL